MAGTKLIVDADEVRERMSLADLPEIIEAIDRGLTAAHVAFAGALGSTFEEIVDTSEVFFLDSSLHPLHPNNQLRLRLKKAFVKPGSVAIRYGLTRGVAMDVAQSTVIPSTDFIVDTDKGLVYIDDIEQRDGASFSALAGTNYNDKYVVVTYTAGFGATSGVNPPEWLREAVLAWMPGALLTKSDDYDKQKKMADNIREQAVLMVEPYKRESAFNYMPIY